MGETERGERRERGRQGRGGREDRNAQKKGTMKELIRASFLSCSFFSTVPQASEDANKDEPEDANGGAGGAGMGTGDDDDDMGGDDEHKADEVDDSGLVGSSNSNDTEDHFVPR